MLCYAENLNVNSHNKNSLIFSGLFHGVIRPEEPYGVSLDEKILPQYMQEMGYATHIVGKVVMYEFFLDVFLYEKQSVNGIK